MKKRQAKYGTWRWEGIEEGKVEIQIAQSHKENKLGSSRVVFNSLFTVCVGGVGHMEYLSIKTDCFACGKSTLIQDTSLQFLWSLSG